LVLMQGKGLRLVWIDTISRYPIYSGLENLGLYHSNLDVALPLAAVYLRAYLARERPQVEFSYHPRRLYEAQGKQLPIEELVLDGDVVLASCSTADSEDAREILRIAKAAGRVTVLGGIFPKFSWSEALGWGVVDYICSGEGERAIVEIVDHILDSESGGAKQGGIVIGPAFPKMAQLVDLSGLPDPDYGCFPINDFLPYMNSAYILATRGCPAPCHFCTSARQYGFSYRMRPVDSVVRELRQLFDLGFRKMSLADDTVLVDKEWASSLFDALARENPGYTLKVRARADELSPEMIARMVDAGVEVVQFGVESVSLSTRLSMHKRLDQKSVEGAFELLSRAPSLKANPLYMMAYPGETRADLAANTEFMKSMGSDSRTITYLSFTTPYPGTGFAEKLVPSKGHLLTRDRKYFTNKFPVFVPNSLIEEGVRETLDWLVSMYDDVCRSLSEVWPIYHPIPAEFFQDAEIPG
jgi:radical SAM superfamily enzyme YgiQ (UPF0313 family)